MIEGGVGINDDRLVDSGLTWRLWDCGNSQLPFATSAIIILYFVQFSHWTCAWEMWGWEEAAYSKFQAWLVFSWFYFTFIKKDQICLQIEWKCDVDETRAIISFQHNFISHSHVDNHCCNICHVSDVWQLCVLRIDGKGLCTIQYFSAKLLTKNRIQNLFNCQMFKPTDDWPPKLQNDWHPDWLGPMEVNLFWTHSYCKLEDDWPRVYTMV